MSLRRSILTALLLVAATVGMRNPAQSEAPSATEPDLATRVEALLPSIEGYIADGMKAFDSPGLAIGIVAGDKLVYAKGFGVRDRKSQLPIDTRTIFQIGSTTKAFLATTQAIMVDRGKLKWDDRVVDLYPAFQLKDPWVTREFRVFDLLAQRSGLQPFVNDPLALLDYDEAALIRSLRFAEPASSFRSTAAYTNLTHLLAARIVANAAGAPDWSTVLQRELFDPLGMRDSTTTAEAIEAAANHAKGHRWTPEGTLEVPFTPIFPYGYVGAGNINSNIEDMARWLRMQVGNGTFEGRSIVSAESLDFTRTPKVAVFRTAAYALGWIVYGSPNANILYHGGDTLSFGAFVGFVPEKKIGVVVLVNEQNMGFPEAVGMWVLDRLLGNPDVDHVSNVLEAAKATFETTEKRFARPANPRPFPPLSPRAGIFVNPSFGEVAVDEDSDGLLVKIRATGAELRLIPFDGDVFLASLVPAGRFEPIVDLGPMSRAFAQFQMDAAGKLNLLRLSFEDGNQFEFQRK